MLIPHGIEPTINKHINNRNEKLVIGYLGRLHQEQKNILLIPKVLKKISIDYHFELIGDGKDKQSLIEELDKNNISYTAFGRIDNADINDYICKWDVFIFPSITEGFGLTLIEVMNMGIVPIANEIKGVTDYIITDGKDGFTVNDNNIEVYVQRLEQLNDNRQLLEKMKNEARITVEQRFNLISVIEQYKNTFYEVITKPKTKCTNIADWKPYVEYKPSILKRLSNFLNSLKNIN